MSRSELLKSVTANLMKKKVPAIKAGQSVRVHQRIKEGAKERIQIFEGLIIRINAGHDVSKTFTVRKIVEGIGVEKIFPLYSPSIEKIQIIKEAKIRRAKLYYMRNLSGKSARLKEEMMEAMGATVEETPMEEEKASTSDGTDEVEEKKE